MNSLKKEPGAFLWILEDGRLGNGEKSSSSIDTLGDIIEYHINNGKLEPLISQWKVLKGSFKKSHNNYILASYLLDCSIQSIQNNDSMNLDKLLEKSRDKASDLININDMNDAVNDVRKYFIGCRVLEFLQLHAKNTKQAVTNNTHLINQDTSKMDAEDIYNIFVNDYQGSYETAIKLRDQNGNTLLHICAFKKKQDNKKKNSEQLISFVTEFGNSLHPSNLNDYIIAFCERLIKLGLDINIKNNFGETAISYARQNNIANLTNLLETAAHQKTSKPTETIHLKRIQKKPKEKTKEEQEIEDLLSGFSAPDDE